MMATRIAACVAAPALLLHFSTLAVAQDADATAQRTEQLLLKLERMLSEPKAASPRAVVNRSARFRLVATFRKKTVFDLPMRCGFSVSHQSTTASFQESKSAPVRFNGNVGTCVVAISFTWPNADDTFPVRFQATVGFAGTAGATTVFRNGGWTLPDLPLPAEGSSTDITLDRAL